MSFYNQLTSNINASAYKLRTSNSLLLWTIVLSNFFCDGIISIWRSLIHGSKHERDPGRILVIRADRIGDMVLATPIFKPLKERYPNAKVSCLASSLSSQLIEGIPYIDEIITYDPPWFDRRKGRFVNDILDMFRIIRIIKARNFDMAIDLRGNVFNFFFLMFITRIRQRVSFDASFGTFLLTRKIPFKPGKHETALFQDVIRSLGGKTVADPQPIIVLSEREKAFANQFFMKNKLSPDQLLICIHPGAGVGRTFKIWPEEYYIMLCKLLTTKYNAVIIISGSKHELELAKRIKQHVGAQCILAAGEIKRLKDLAAVLKRCSVFISTSTGIMHLATAVNLPVVVLCGPEDPDRWHPLGNLNTLIKRDMPCRPCRETSCEYEGKCLKQITPEEVFTALKEYVR